MNRQEACTPHFVSCGGDRNQIVFELRSNVHGNPEWTAPNENHDRRRTLHLQQTWFDRQDFRSNLQCFSTELNCGNKSYPEVHHRRCLATLSPSYCCIEQTQSRDPDVSVFLSSTRRTECNIRRVKITMLCRFLILEQQLTSLVKHSLGNFTSHKNVFGIGACNV